MNQSRMSQSQKTQRYFQQSSCRKVKIYIRIASRKSLKIQLPGQILLNQLKQIIRKIFRISQHNQVLYLKGICINYNKEVLLENDWIIHVIDLSQVKLPEINFYLKPQSLQQNNDYQDKYVASSKMVIKDFVHQNILDQFSVKLQQIMLIESGRILKLNSSFEKQNIQNGTTLNLIHVKKDQKASTSNHRLINTNNKVYQRSIIGVKSQQHKVNKSSQKSNLTQGSFLKISQNTKKIEDDAKSNISNLSHRYNHVKSPKNSNKCQLHQKNTHKFRQSAHNIQHNQNDLSSSIQSIQSTRQNICSPNRSIPIGQRQCNCKKQPNHVLSKSPKFISMEDKKKLQKQIRQQNLQKLMLKKHRQQQKQKSNASTVKKIGIQNVKSLQVIKPGRFTQRKPTKAINNPQKIVNL